MIKKCDQCGIEINRKHIKKTKSGFNFCSRGCAQNAQKKGGILVRLSKWTKAIIIEEIIALGAPSDIIARKFYSPLHCAAVKRFGSWKAAIESAGFDYKDVLLLSGQKSLGLDGEIYDSISECIIANSLYVLKRSDEIRNYKVHQKVCQDRFWTCDFVIEFDGEVVWLEYDGWKKREDHQKYDYYKEFCPDVVVFKNYRKAIDFILERTNFSYQDLLPEITNVKNFNRDSLKKLVVEDIERVSKIVGGTPAAMEYAKYGRVAALDTVKRNFGWTKLLEEMGLTKNHRIFLKGKTKLSKDDVLAIYNSCCDGVHHQSLADKYGVSRKCIFDIATGRTWSVVTEFLSPGE